MHGKYVKCNQLLRFISKLKDAGGRLEFHTPNCRFTPRFKNAEEILSALKMIRDDKVHRGFPYSDRDRPLPIESIIFEIRSLKLEETHIAKHLVFSMHGINFEMDAEPSSYVLEIKMSGVLEIDDFFALF